MHFVGPWHSVFPKAKQRSHTSHGNQFKQDTPRPIKGIQIPESAKILLVESPESWALESAISLRIGIQNPRSNDKDRDPLPGIWNPGPLHTTFRPRLLMTALERCKNYFSHNLIFTPSVSTMSRFNTLLQPVIFVLVQIKIRDCN